MCACVCVCEVMQLINCLMTPYILTIAAIEEESAAAAAESVISQERTKGDKQRAPLSLL